MNKLIFATNNKNKVNEVRNLLGNRFEVITLQEAGINIDIPEPHDTLEANATEKSTTIHAMTGKNCFSEDTGLFVDALNGAPGVKSARYAGETKTSQDNINKLLANLQEIEHRKARFRTVISLLLNGEEHQFEGICEGRIIKEQQGCNGFGYDSVFVPDGSMKTFAEMDMAQKSQYSHRRKAMDKLIAFLVSGT
jgi:XTP/dITP diphosphohydrolase